MKILVDGDACPVKAIIVDVAKENALDVWMFFDTSHQYEDGYSRVFILDKGHDAVDYALINETSPNDIVVTQDYGVATMALAKKAYPIHPNGLIFTEHNIDQLLHSRYTHQKMRRANKRTKGPKKRTKEHDHHFQQQFILLVQQVSKQLEEELHHE